MTFDSHLRRTVHAGEGCLDKEENLRNIRTAIELLRADGLGHAIHLPHSHALLQEVKLKRIRVESNPVSNMTLGYISDIGELQIDKLLRDGVLISINSDDPAVWNRGSLAENLYAVAQAYDFEMDDVKRLILNGVMGAFISDKEKAQLAEAFSAG
jgi:adenosine deaminase